MIQDFKVCTKISFSNIESEFKMDKNHDERYVSMISIDSESCMSIIHEK